LSNCLNVEKEKQTIDQSVKLTLKILSEI